MCVKGVAKEEMEAVGDNEGRKKGEEGKIVREVGTIRGGVVINMV